MPFDAGGFVRSGRDPRRASGRTRRWWRSTTRRTSSARCSRSPRSAGLCRERGITLVVDASQTAGKVPIDVRGDAHRRALLHRPQVAPRPHRHRRDVRARGRRDPPHARRRHGRPVGRPRRTSTSTRTGWSTARRNTVGIAGLKAGVRWVRSQGDRRDRRATRWRSRGALRDGLRGDRRRHAVLPGRPGRPHRRPRVQRRRPRGG